MLLNVEGKYNNEIENGENVEKTSDEIYLKQIIVDCE